MAMQTNGTNFNNSGFNPYTPTFYPTYTYPQFQPTQTYTSPSNHPVNRSIFGRIVTSENDITPNEVPMDGTVSLFPLVDYSKIFAKQWNPDGTIKTTVFVMEVPQEGSSQTPTFEEEVFRRLDSIEKKLNGRGRKYHKSYNNNGNSQTKDVSSNV